MSSSVGRNSLIMASGTAASRVTGQIRTILLAWALGTTGYAANAYQAGSMIPQVIYTLVSGGIFNAVLVPQIVRTLKSKDAETKLNKLITLAITLLLGVTLLMAVATPLLTKLYVNGSAETMALATSFTLWCMPQIFFYGLYTVIGQILAAKDHFVTYAWSSVGANIISCIGFGAFIAMFGRATERPLDFWTPTKIALTAGTWTLGVAFQALVLFIPLTRIGLKYRPKFGVHGIGLRSMGPVAAWSLGIVGVDQIVNIIVTRVATSAPFKASEQLHMSQLDVAGNASYQNAYTIYMLPYSLIAVSIATAIFPKISKAIADRNIDEARMDLSCFRCRSSSHCCRPSACVRRCSSARRSPLWASACHFPARIWSSNARSTRSKTASIRLFSWRSPWPSRVASSSRRRPFCRPRSGSPSSDWRFR